MFLLFLFILVIGFSLLVLLYGTPCVRYGLIGWGGALNTIVGIREVDTSLCKPGGEQFLLFKQVMIIIHLAKKSAASDHIQQNGRVRLLIIILKRPHQMTTKQPLNKQSAHNRI